MLEWEPWEIDLAASALPRYWGKLAWPLAQLSVDFREMFFPRHLEPEPPKEPPKPRRPWTVRELLPPFADWPLSSPFGPRATRLLLSARDTLPAWCAEAVEWEALEPVE